MKLNKIITVISIVLLFFQSCSNSCNDKSIKFLEKVEKGDYQTLKDYLEEGGNPNLECWDTRTGGFGGTTKSLPWILIESDSFEIIKYYLNFNVSLENKDIFLLYYIEKNNIKMAQFMVSKGANYLSISKIGYVEPKSTINHFNFLKKINFDFNQQDVKTGNTHLINYSKYPAKNIRDEKNLIIAIKVLIDCGAKLSIKNNAGKTAIDICANPKVKKLLQNSHN